MELRILGPFQAFDDSGREVALPTGRERALLAALVLRRGEVVSVDSLVEALWGDTAPSTAVKAVQGYVSHLRRVLGSDGALITQAPGYALRVPAEAVDAHRFETLAAEAWRTLQDDAEAALATFARALAFWRGPALVEFAFADFAQREIRRLEELRLETVEGRFEAMLQLGRHGAVVAELETRVAEHPLRERLRGQLMLALYRSGRQAEALEVYRDVRRLMADELGLEPGGELQRLERAILAQDPSLDAPVAHPRPKAASVPPAPAARRRGAGRRVAVGVALIAVAAAAATLGYLVVADEPSASVAATPPTLAVIDPATNTVVASIPVGSKPVAIAAGAGSVWVGDARDGTITRVDPLTRRVAKTIGIGAPVVDLATGLGGVWAATGGFGEIVRIDPEVGAVAQRVPLGDPADPVVPSVPSVAVGDGRVWAGVPEGLARIDPRSGEVAETIDLDSAQALQIAAGGGAVWVTTIANRAERVEARSGRKTAEFYAGGWVYPVTLDGRAVWVGGLRGLAKLDADTGASLTSSGAVKAVTGIAYGAGSVWLTNAATAEVFRLNADTGAVEARIPLGGFGEDVAVDRGLVWIVVPPSD
ncbi:MAG TPA: BTAD domain-containing putative transcriptional regulator [Gaiella sp.]|nr:BTAD domain-containing putative transcriptional regulator [Gaiella sp.]